MPTKHDLILERISSITRELNSFTENSRRENDSIIQSMDKMNNSIESVKALLDSNNNRVSKLEAVHLSCPAHELNVNFEAYKKDLRPVYVLATNYRMIAFIAVGAALAFHLMDIGVSWLTNLLTI